MPKTLSRKEALAEVVAEVARFRSRIREVESTAAESHSSYPLHDYPAEWAALKRSSMDLTRSLARLRRAT